MSDMTEIKKAIDEFEHACYSVAFGVVDGRCDVREYISRENDKNEKRAHLLELIKEVMG